MRRLPALAAITFLASAFALSQVPRTLSYQGLLTDSLGTPKPDNTYNLTFRLYWSVSGGTPLWTETRSLQTKRGLFSTVLGGQTPIPDSLRFNRQYWLGVQLSGEPEMSPRMPLAAVGYSLRAAKADTANYAVAAPQAAFVDSARVAGSVQAPLNFDANLPVPIFSVNNSGDGDAIFGSSSGAGSAASFATWSGATGVAAVSAVTYTTNIVGDFFNKRPDNNNPVLRASSVGGGTAVLGFNSGTGKGGQFQVYTADNPSTALEGVTGGTGPAGYFHIENPSSSSRCLEAHTSGTGDGFYGYTAQGQHGVYGKSDGPNGIGVKGTASSALSAAGVYGEVTATTSYGSGVAGTAATYNGVGGTFLNSGPGIGLSVYGAGDAAERPALKVHNASSTYGMAAVITNRSGYHTAHFENLSTGGVLYLRNQGDAAGTGGNDFITAVAANSFDVQFRVASSGEAQSDVGFTTPAADFAEMLPAEMGLEPADVLVIGEDGTLILSSEPYQTNVAGVYSTQPGFTGGKPVEGSVAGTIPLAISGIVPAKVSAENGPIKPGDLLVTSSTPGYAMKADRNPVQGSVIGKALGKLESGKGSIRILAILQ